METVRNFWNCKLEPTFTLFHHPGTEITLVLNAVASLHPPKTVITFVKTLHTVSWNLVLFCMYISLLCDTEELDVILFRIYELQRVMVAK